MNEEKNVNNEVPINNQKLNPNNNEVVSNSVEVQNVVSQSQIQTPPPVQNVGPKLEIITDNKIIQEGIPEVKKEEAGKKKVLTPTLIVELIILGILGLFCLWFYVLR